MNEKYLNKIINGDALTSLKLLEDNSVHCIVTSPPYFPALRDYNAGGQIGRESTLEEYVQKLTDIFNECKRILHPHGSFYLNIGDSYDKKSGDLRGVPWSVAFSLKKEGWILRNENIWTKCFGKPMSFKDRFSTNHEQVFFFVKQRNYFFSHRNLQDKFDNLKNRKWQWNTHKSIIFLSEGKTDMEITPDYKLSGVNMKTVWNITPSQTAEQHYAVFPKELAMVCISASTSDYGCCIKCLTPYNEEIQKLSIGPGRELRKNMKSLVYSPPKNKLSNSVKRYVKSSGYKKQCNCDINEAGPYTVLDPFNGFGTSIIVAKELKHNFIGIELSTDYCNMARERFKKELNLEVDIIV